MTDLDPEIWNNETLGDAAHNERLDRLEKQQHENRAARLENREPREVVVDNTYPDWTPEVAQRTGTVPSMYQTVHFADENPNDIPVNSDNVDNTAASVQNVEPEQEENDSDEVQADSGPETSTEEDSISTSDSAYEYTTVPGNHEATVYENDEVASDSDEESDSR